MDRVRSTRAIHKRDVSRVESRHGDTKDGSVVQRISTHTYRHYYKGTYLAKLEIVSFGVIAGSFQSGHFEDHDFLSRSAQAVCGVISAAVLLLLLVVVVGVVVFGEVTGRWSSTNV